MKKVLVIENDIDTLDLIGYLIEDVGYEVLKSNKKLSVQKIISISPNLILLDHFLNDGFGNELCMEIKAHHLSKHIPVILMSVIAGLEVIAQTSGADAFIPKPFDVYYLENKVRELAL